jgi:type IV pilus assembly protein PilA
MRESKQLRRSRTDAKNWSVWYSLGTEIQPYFFATITDSQLYLNIVLLPASYSAAIKRGEELRQDKIKGFSLIELLIVVAIILIIAAIAIPNLLRARMAANDSSAAASVHTIIVGEIGYYGAYPTIGYATLTQLGNSAAPAVCTPSPATGCLIDNTLAVATAAPGKSGYIFQAMAIDAAVPYQF